MKFHALLAVCLTGALLLPATGCAKKPIMEVPDTDTVVFTQTKPVSLEEWNDAEKTLACPPVRQEIQLSSGGTATLYALDTGAEPTADTDEITSVNDEMVLNSEAVLLGEHGTPQELAEAELYHWANTDAFDGVRYTQPLQVNDGRYFVHLQLGNGKIGMEQAVIYTDLGSGVARVDRLWRSIVDVVADTGSDEFEQTAAYLASDATMP